MPHVPAARGSFLFPSWLLPGDRFWVEFFSPTFCSLVHLFIPSFRRPLIENAGAESWWHGEHSGGCGGAQGGGDMWAWLLQI